MSFVPVRVAGTGSFLPGAPVSNDRVEMVLGTLDKALPKVKNFVENQGPKFLEQSGIQSRHFAVDPETGDLTHTHSSLAENAARQALEMACMKPEEMELIVVSCPTYDHGTPPTSALLQERLNIQIARKSKFTPIAQASAKACRLLLMPCALAGTARLS